jgi:putative ABC transport system permease protein
LYFLSFRPPALPGEQPQAGLLLVTPGYFQALEISLQLGRYFTERDDEQHPAAIINQTLARRYFHEGSSPIGQRITLGRAGPQSIWMPVVGIVGDVHHQDLGEPPRPEVYLPYAQQTSRRMTVVVRTDGDPLAYVNSMRSAVWAVDRDQPVSAIRSMARVIEDRVEAYRAVTQVMGTLSLCALLLAAVGIFGMLSYAVSERIHEIGVRMALGAQRGDICRVVLFRGIALVLLGLAIGIPGALGSMRLISSQLFGVAPTDPLTYALTSLILFAVALTAMLLPARRAMAVDPVLALRSE